MRLVLDDVEVQRGRFSLRASGVFPEGVHLIWGPVGCGKSTLAHFLAGLLTSHRGSIRKEGIHRLHLLMQFPEYQVTAGTLEDEIRSYGGDADWVLQRAGLGTRKDHDPFTLSRGELKRLLFTTFLRPAPDLLILDEPFGGIDCRERQRLIDNLAEIAPPVTLLFTHDTGPFPLLDHLWEIQGGDLISHRDMPDRSGPQVSFLRTFFMERSDPSHRPRNNGGEL